MCRSYISHTLWWHLGASIIGKMGRTDLGATSMRQTYRHTYTNCLRENVENQSCTQPVKQGRETKMNEVSMRRGSQMRTKMMILGLPLNFLIYLVSSHLPDLGSFRCSSCHLKKSPMCLFIISLCVFCLKSENFTIHSLYYLRDADYFFSNAKEN